MESFVLAASTVMPLLVYMAVGGLIRKLGIFFQENFKALNVLIFRIFIPLTLFFSVYDADLKQAVRPDVFSFILIGVLLVYGVVWVAVSRLVQEGRDAATMIQGIYRSNYVLFGNTIAVSMCDKEGVALVAALSAAVVPLFNILSVILFETKRGGQVQVSQIVKNIVKNPLVEAGIGGCIFNFLGIPIPELLARPLMEMGNIATPLALVTLGGMLSFGSIMKHRKYLMAVVLNRLFVVPLAMTAAAIFLGFRGDVLVAVIAVFASPTAVASAPMAQAMGGNGALAGEIVAMTSVCCILSIFLFVFCLSGFGMV